MFKINFERAFREMDSDYLKGIGVSDNKIYIKWHYRNRIVYPTCGDSYFQKAYNMIYKYTCKDEKEAYALFDSMNKKDSKEIWHHFRNKELVIK